MEIAVAGEGLSYQLRSDNFPVALNQAAVRLIGKDDRGQASDSEWIGKSRQKCERDKENKRRSEFFKHGSVSLGEMQATDHEVDGLDADKWNDHAAEAVDQQVAAQKRASPNRTVGDAFQRQWNECDDDQRVED